MNIRKMKWCTKQSSITEIKIEPVVYNMYVRSPF